MGPLRFVVSENRGPTLTGFLPSLVVFFFQIGSLVTCTLDYIPAVEFRHESRSVLALVRLSTMLRSLRKTRLSGRRGKGVSRGMSKTNKSTLSDMWVSETSRKRKEHWRDSGKVLDVERDPVQVTRIPSRNAGSEVFGKL